MLNKERQGAYLGADCPDHPPHYRRDQELHLQPGQGAPRPTLSSPRSAAPPATSRASPSWRPSARWAWSRAAENCLLHPRGAGSLYFRFRRVQVQADPALRARSCRAWASHPDVIVLPCRRPCRQRHQAQDQHCSAMCRPDCVIENLTMPSLYECPLMLEAAGLTNVVARQLQPADPAQPDLTEWKEHDAAALPPAAATARSPWWASTLSCTMPT